MTRFWLEISIATLEAALVVRIGWLIHRSRRWDRRRLRWTMVRALLERESELWNLHRDREAFEARRLYEIETGLPAFTLTVFDDLDPRLLTGLRVVS